jgi:hypothetical protein
MKILERYFFVNIAQAVASCWWPSWPWPPSWT